jgi:hypothetical protein
MGEGFLCHHTFFRVKDREAAIQLMRSCR